MKSEKYGNKENNNAYPGICTYVLTTKKISIAEIAYTSNNPKDTLGRGLRECLNSHQVKR